jgi:hypothetical protein
MCRERAALARKEMEYSLMEYWLAEAEEWKQLRESLEPEFRTAPVTCRDRTTPKANDTRWKTIAEASRLREV